MKKTVLLLLLVPAALIWGQNKTTADKPGVSLSGYIKTDVIYDTRQTVNAREGHFLLYPSPVKNDAAGEDINNRNSFNILSIQSRLSLSATGPEMLGAKPTSFAEGEFFGHSNADINGFRLRHAYLKLQWSELSLLMGQYWHPMFVPEVSAGVVSFNTGAPFQPFSRNPQIRLTYSMGKLNLIAAAAAQRDFSSPGPSGASSAYLRNTGIPNLHLQLQYKDGELIMGSGGDFKRITPKIETAKNYRTDAALNSFAALAYIKFKVSPLTVKFEGVYGQNLADMFMLGGYAVKSIDTIKGIEDYSSLNVASFWCDLQTGKELQAGLFIGYTKNLGSKDAVTGTVYSNAANLGELLRVAPRIQWRKGNLSFGAEYEFTSAKYGKLTQKAAVENSVKAVNSRILFAGYYYFDI